MPTSTRCSSWNRTLLVGPVDLRPLVVRVQGQRRLEFFLRRLLLSSPEFAEADEIVGLGHLTVVRLLLAGPIDRQRLVQALIRQLSSAVDAVRPNRSFARNTPGKLKPGFHPAYKRAA